MTEAEDRDDASRLTPKGSAPVPGRPVPARDAVAGRAPAPVIKLGGPVSALSPEAAVKKKETARITVEPARPAGAGGAPAAGIRAATPAMGLQPPSTIKITRPGQTAQISLGTPGAELPEFMKKKTTSRITLETAIGTREAEAAADSGPKTIRLKRPGEGASPRVSAAATTIRVRRPGVEGVGDPSLEAPAGPGEAAGEATTQRRTVVIKRAAEGTVGAGEAAAALSRPAPVVVVRAPDKVNWVYGLYASAATILVMIGIYMLCSQILGPNVSMTQYSYSVDGPRLIWPRLLTREFLDISEQRWVAKRQAERVESEGKVMAPEAIVERPATTESLETPKEEAPAAEPVDLLGSEDEFADEI